MKKTPLSARISRWIARIWSVLLAVLIFLMFGLPAIEAPGGAPLPAIDILLIGLFGLAALGLLLAWRWEQAGAWIAIAATLVQLLLFAVTKNFWDAGLLFQAAVFLIPAILYLLAHKLAGGWT